jgi:hypothetical protein
VAELSHLVGEAKAKPRKDDEAKVRGIPGYANEKKWQMACVTTDDTITFWYFAQALAAPLFLPPFAFG